MEFLVSRKRGLQHLDEAFWVLGSLYPLFGKDYDPDSNLCSGFQSRQRSEVALELFICLLRGVAVNAAFSVDCVRTRWWWCGGEGRTWCRQARVLHATMMLLSSNHDFHTKLCYGGPFRPGPVASKCVFWQLSSQMLMAMVRKLRMRQERAASALRVV